MVRWFQYGAFCPIFRLHGFRYSDTLDMHTGTGADNEVWSFGEEAYGILTKFLSIREKFRPYSVCRSAIRETWYTVLRPRRKGER